MIEDRRREMLAAASGDAPLYHGLLRNDCKFEFPQRARGENITRQSRDATGSLDCHVVAGGTARHDARRFPITQRHSQIGAQISDRLKSYAAQEVRAGLAAQKTQRHKIVFITGRGEGAAWHSSVVASSLRKSMPTQPIPASSAGVGSAGASFSKQELRARRPAARVFITPRLEAATTCPSMLVGWMATPMTTAGVLSTADEGEEDSRVQHEGLRDLAMPGFVVSCSYLVGCTVRRWRFQAGSSSECQAKTGIVLLYWGEQTPGKLGHAALSALLQDGEKLRTPFSEAFTGWLISVLEVCARPLNHGNLMSRTELKRTTCPTSMRESHTQNDGCAQIL